MAMAMALDPQRTLDLSASGQPKKRSKKGQHMGGKWSWSDEELKALLQVSTEFDQCLIGVGAFWGYRISELMSLTVDEVMNPDGSLRPFITVPSARLKGGKEPKVKPLPPKPANHDPECSCNLCHPKQHKRRKPEDRTVPMGAAAPYIIARLRALAKARKRDGVVAHLYGQGIYLFESRKRGKDGSSKSISRQQAWYRLRQVMRKAGMDPTHFATHSLGKTSAQNMMITTKRIDFVRDWLGHASSATTEKYLRSDNRERLAFAAAMGERLLGSVA
jgi:integrase